MIIWFDSLTDFKFKSWTEQWMFSARVRRICKERFGAEGFDWSPIDQAGHLTIAALPFGVQFNKDEDATVFKLIYEQETSSNNT